MLTFMQRSKAWPGWARLPMAGNDGFSFRSEGQANESYLYLADLYLWCVCMGCFARHPDLSFFTLTLKRYRLQWLIRVPAKCTWNGLKDLKTSENTWIAKFCSGHVWEQTSLSRERQIFPQMEGTEHNGYESKITKVSWRGRTCRTVSHLHGNVDVLRLKKQAYCHGCHCDMDDPIAHICKQQLLISISALYCCSLVPRAWLA